MAESPRLAIPETPVKVFRAVVRLPFVADAVRRGGQVRDAVLQAQESLLGALNLPTASDLASVASRLRSISQRLELLEDALERVDRSVARLPSVLNPETERV
jgi:hypothetical protein